MTSTPRPEEKPTPATYSAPSSYGSVAGGRTPVHGHPQVDLISVYHHPWEPLENTPEQVEIAFFRTRDGETTWVLDPVDDFAQYADPIAGDTRVYTGVPLADVLAWIDRYREAPERVTEPSPSRSTVRRADTHGSARREP